MINPIFFPVQLSPFNGPAMAAILQEKGELSTMHLPLGLQHFPIGLRSKQPQIQYILGRLGVTREYNSTISTEREATDVVIYDEPVAIATAEEESTIDAASQPVEIVDLFQCGSSKSSHLRTETAGIKSSL